MSEIKCKICGSLEDPDQYIPKVYKTLHENHICMSCFHWNEQLLLDREVRGEHEWAVIGGVHYVIRPDDSNAYFKGHGGSEFKIRFFDGTEIITHNLWCQGVIPDTWKDKFPNNATFTEN